MSKCCCCCSVVTGATILGVIGMIFSSLELVPLIPFLIESESFNPLEENQEQIFFIVEKILEENRFSKEDISNIIETIRSIMWPAVLAEAVSAGVYAVFALLLVVGVQYKKKGLMLPYMIIQMTMTVIFMAAGVTGTIAFFFKNIILGVVSGVVVLVVSFLLIYFWIVVQRAFVHIGMYANYTPAPTIKPLYMASSQHYPMAPQHFQMDESMNGK